MHKNILLLFWFLIINTQPIFAQKQSVEVNTNLTFVSEKFLGEINGHRYSSEGSTKFDLFYNLNNFSSQLSLNYGKDEKYTIDGSYIQHTSGVLTYGIGLIDRQWSFSDKTSLILSQNARPFKSIYLKLKNNVQNDWLFENANWSLEVFNGFTEGSLSNSGSMILGSRAILTPFQGLSFELVKTSQWGGKGHSTGISALTAAMIKDTNTKKNSNINKMAGFGVSYKIPKRSLPFRIYGQAVGEDEAGSLPSCYSYIAGLEWANKKIRYPTIVSIEAVDTRVDTSKNGNCGPNTIYNNNTYDYTNYGKTMGTAIDTEGTSLSLHIASQISQKINIQFETKSIVINDNNWSGHRLSSERQSGITNSLGISWVKDKISLNGNIYNHGFNLNKVNIKSGFGASFSSSLKF